MTLRLVLVSLVAGLGISVPGWPMLEGWVASSQKWMNARLAEWDDRQSDEQNYVVIHDLLKVEMERARTARLAKQAANHRPLAVAAAPAASEGPRHAGVHTVSLERSAHAVRNAVALFPRPVEVRAIASDRRAEAEVVSTERVESPKPAPASFEPLVVGDRLYVGTAFDLNYRNEGIGILPKVVVRPDPTHAAQPVELVGVMVDRFGPSALQAARELGRDLRSVAVRELAAREAADAERAAREAESRELAVREAESLEFEALGNSENLYFADAPIAPIMAAPQIVAEVSTFEAMENSENLYFAESLVAHAPEPVAEAAPVVDTTSVEPVVAFEALPDDPFAPAEPVATVEQQDAQQPGASEPTGEVEKSTEPEVVAIRTVQNTQVRRPGVSRAVRLTREALYAWVNVLSEPSLVAVGPTQTSNR